MEGPRVHVRPLLDEDIGPHYAAWFDDPEIRRFIKFARQAPSVGDLRAYRASMATRSDVDFLGVLLNDGGRHIGNLKFEAGPQPDEMHVGFLIGDPDWRRAGVLTEILPPCIARVMATRKPRRLYLTVDPLNAPGIRAFTKLGFQSTGTIDRAGDLEMDYRRPAEAPSVKHEPVGPPVAVLDHRQGSVVRVDLDAIPNREILSMLVERYYDSEMPDAELSSHLRLYSSKFRIEAGDDGQLTGARGEGFGVVRWDSAILRWLDKACISSHLIWLDHRRDLLRALEDARRVCEAMQIQVTMDVFRQACTAALLVRHLDGWQSPRFLMIGDGYGVLSSLLKRRYPDAAIAAVDLGRPLLFQAYLNQRAHPGAAHALAGAGPRWAEADFVYCPAEQLDVLAPFKFDVAINIASMQEMTVPQIGRYFSFLRQTLAPRNLFYCCNRERKELVGGDVSEFQRYPWGPKDRVAVDGVCPWHRYFFSVSRVAGVPLPVVAYYDGRVLHRLATMATT
jgi:RimJ/RimL family protein N-acetyltransferase